MNLETNLETLLWQNRVEDHVFAFHDDEKTMDGVAKLLVLALARSTKHGMDCARSKYGQFVVGCGGRYPVAKGTEWRNLVEGWLFRASIGDLSLLNGLGAYPRSIVITPPLRVGLPVRTDGGIFVTRHCDGFLLRRDGDQSPFYNIHPNNPGPLGDPNPTKPAVQLDKVVEGLYDAMLGKPACMPKDALLAEYKRMTGKDMPGFMR